jgi:iron complex outermembrane receptor protein
MRLQRKRHVVALAYALGVCSAAGLFGASAQDQRILVTVTGSNIIPRVEGETSLPVQVITHEDIERANIQTAAELVNTLSANMSYGAFNETQSMNGGASQPGFAGASLRGLGYNRTLILLNGRRIANYAFSQNGGDLNSIPVSAIKRVEVLKDGASAVYGSDAIAGVINFILRQDYRGAEAYAQYSSPEHTGGYSTHYNAAAGYGDSPRPTISRRSTSTIPPATVFPPTSIRR